MVAFRSLNLAGCALACLFCCCSASWAATGDSPLPTDFSVASPRIPDHTFKLTDFGAVADGKTLNTAAIDQALHACEQAGGGTVEIPRGTYLIAPFALVSNCNLHLDQGATLRFSDKLADYPKKKNRLQDCISLDKGHDIAITGAGTIDGQGQWFWKNLVPPKGAESSTSMPHRPFLIQLTRCTRVLVQGVTLTNSPMFHLAASNCTDVTIDGITIRAPESAKNTDGIDPSGRNFHILNCTIDTGDDNVAIKPASGAGDGAPGDENFLIEHCTFRHGHGCSIGGQTNNGLRNLLVRDCTFTGTDAGIRMKSTRGRGGVVEDLAYENLTMTGVKNAIQIVSYYPQVPAAPQDDPKQQVTDLTPVWRHIRISHVTAEGGTLAGQIVGLPEMPVQDVVLSDVHITAQQPMQIVNAQNIVFQNSTVLSNSGEPPHVVNAAVQGLSGRQ